MIKFEPDTGEKNCSSPGSGLKILTEKRIYLSRTWIPEKRIGFSPCSGPNLIPEKETFVLLCVLVKILRIREVFKTEPKPEKTQKKVYLLQNSSPNLIFEGEKRVLLCV